MYNKDVDMGYTDAPFKYIPFKKISKYAVCQHMTNPLVERRGLEAFCNESNNVQLQHLGSCMIL